MVTNHVQPPRGAFNGDCFAGVAFPTQIERPESGAQPPVACGAGSNGGPDARPSHAPYIRTALKRLCAALREAFECERDLCGMPNGMDPAVDAWIAAAEAARGTVMSLAKLIVESFDGDAAAEGTARGFAVLTLDLLATVSGPRLGKLREDLLDLEWTARCMATAPEEMWGDIAEAAAWLRAYIDLDPPVDHGALDGPASGSAVAF